MPAPKATASAPGRSAIKKVSEALVTWLKRSCCSVWPRRKASWMRGLMIGRICERRESSRSACMRVGTKNGCQAVSRGCQAAISRVGSV